MLAARVRVAPEVYRLYCEIGSTRSRHIAELLYRREERADIEAMREVARQPHRAQEMTPPGFDTIEGGGV
jgi:hypothetical protein